MKILLSAYACEPGRGSEPGVGWHWMLALAERPGVELHVVTRANNRMAIEAYRSVHPETWSVHFHYYDLPRRSLERARRMTWQCRVEETYAEIEKALRTLGRSDEKI